jgi:hypothetical protein
MESDPIDSGARIVADGAQPARIDLLHIHGGILKQFRAWLD